jgi:hypothetical protein
MSRLNPARALALVGAVVAAAALAGCGKTGDLQRPAPLFGHARNGPPPADQSRGEDPTRPINTIDPRDTLDNPAPSRTIEVPGQSPNPIAPGPQGSLPDPYADPR